MYSPDAVSILVYKSRLHHISYKLKIVNMKTYRNIDIIHLYFSDPRVIFVHRSNIINIHSTHIIRMNTLIIYNTIRLEGVHRLRRNRLSWLVCLCCICGKPTF